MLTLENFYSSDLWAALRQRLMLERVNDGGELICEYCGQPIVKPYDCIGHHKIELTADNVNDYEISLNPDNVALIHFKCHNLIHQRFEGFKQCVYLVYGAPYSGKADWVKEVAYQDDLILDLDRLWEAVCLSDRFHKPNRLKANVFGIRDAVIEQIKVRAGKWRNAYIIGGYPLRTDRDRLCSLLRAKPIYIQATKAECLSHVTDAKWRDYVEEWFENYVE